MAQGLLHRGSLEVARAEAPETTFAAASLAKLLDSGGPAVRTSSAHFERRARYQTRRTGGPCIEGPDFVFAGAAI